MDRYFTRKKQNEIKCSMRKKIILIVSGIIFAALLIAAVIHIITDMGHGAEHISGDKKIVVASPHPIEFMKPLLNEFETQTGIRTEVFLCGTSEAIERIQAGESIDILWGGSILAVGSFEELFSPYRILNYDSVRSEFKGVPETITCFTDVPSILLVNTDLAGDLKIEGYEDLLDPALKGKIACASPERSSSSFEHKKIYRVGEVVYLSFEDNTLYAL